MVRDTNDYTFRFELPADLRGPELSQRIHTATRDRAREAGAVAQGDVRLIGTLDLGNGTREHTVRVRLYFGGPA